MRIVFLDTTLSGPIIGGAQIFLPKLAEGLKKNGHEIYIVANGEPNSKVRSEIEACGAILHIHQRKIGLLPEESARFLADWVNSISPDIYVISVSPDLGWLALPWLNRNITTFSIGHTDSQTFYKPAKHYRPLLSMVIGVSDTVCEQYIASGGFSPADVKWIPYGVEVNLTEPVTDKSDPVLRMIYVGRLDEEQKRVSDLATVMLLLSVKGIPFQLKVVGDGQEMAVFSDRLRNEIEKGSVKLTGWLAPNEVLKHFRESEVFLLTSAYEGFCIALTEAMANGCCPVVTDIRSGNKQLITNGENGYLLPVGNTGAFVEVLELLQRDKLLMEERRSAAWESGKRFSVARMVQAYEDIFFTAIQKEQKSPRLSVSDFPVMESCRSPYPRWMRRIKAKLFR